MRAALVDELEDFVRDGSLWDATALNEMIERLDRESSDTGDGVPQMLGRSLRTLLADVERGEVPGSLVADCEAVLYPRIWKVMEASRDGLPDAEHRTRIESMQRRLLQVLDGS